MSKRLPLISKAKQFILDNKFFCASLFIALIAVIVISVPVMNRYQVTYDEGWNLQAPVRMAESGTYASFGNLFEGEDKVFDEYLSTGPAVSVPIAVVFALFGDGVLQARWTMLTFFMLTMVMAASYVYFNTKSKFALLGALWIGVVTSPVVILNFSMLGEIPAIGFALAAFFAFQRKRFVAAGVLSVLAVLSKTIMLFVILAIGGAILITFARERSFKKAWKTTLKYGIGVAIPTAIWESIKLIQLGSPGAYKKNWLDFYDFFKNSGSGIDDGRAYVHFSFIDRVEMILETIDIGNTWIVVAFVALAVVIALGIKERPPKALDVGWKYLAIILFVGGYFVWWVFISNGIFARYTAPLAGISFVAVLAISLELLAKNKTLRNIQYGMLVVASIVCITGFAIRSQHIAQTNTPPQLSTQYEVAGLAKQYEEKGLYHVGWWQNSEIAFIANLHTKNVTFVEDGERYTLLLSPTMKDVAPDLYKDFKSTCQKELYSKEGYVLCEAIRDDKLTY